MPDSALSPKRLAFLQYLNRLLYTGVAPVEALRQAARAYGWENLRPSGGGCSRLSAAEGGLMSAGSRAARRSRL